MTIQLRHDQLELRPCPSAGSLTISFQRTLRIPDDGRTYPLPPGLGTLPLRLISDYAHRVPAAWAHRGGVMLPLYQREAMWLSLDGTPHALQVGIGKVCALTGAPWSGRLRDDPQNYLATRAQPWLDGIVASHGRVRQFVAMPLGKGLTVEAQLTGSETHSGIQLQAFGPKPGRLQRSRASTADDLCCLDECSTELGIGAGGAIDQKVYPDHDGLDVWDANATARVFVHLVNSEMWQQITGEAPPPSPISAATYIAAGLPWFSLYDEHASTLAPTATLAGIKSIEQLEHQALNVKKLPWAVGAKIVDDGKW